MLGNNYSQVYSLRNVFATIYPIENLSGDSIGYALSYFAHDFGVPGQLNLDVFSSQLGRKTMIMKIMRENRMNFHKSDPYQPNRTPAEGSIQ